MLNNLPEPTPLLDFVAGIATTIITYFIIHFIITKIKQHGTQKQRSFFSGKKTPHKTLKDIFRLPWRNKALTPAQQRELFEINRKNQAFINKIWQDEHL